MLGLGAAWFEDEHRAYGFDFPPLKERFEHLEDALNIARKMFTEEVATYEGTHHSIDGALNNPRPMRGDIPILIGGSGEKKTLRMVAQYADGSNFFGDLERVKHLLGVLEGHCERLGRDMGEITKTRMGTLFIARDPRGGDREGRRRDRGGRRRRARCGRMGFIGDPGEVAEQVQALLDAGLDGVTITMPGRPRPRERRARGRDARAR